MFRSWASSRRKSLRSDEHAQNPDHHADLQLDDSEGSARERSASGQLTGPWCHLVDSAYNRLGGTRARLVCGSPLVSARREARFQARRSPADTAFAPTRLAGDTMRAHRIQCCVGWKKAMAAAMTSHMTPTGQSGQQMGCQRGKVGVSDDDAGEMEEGM